MDRIADAPLPERPAQMRLLRAADARGAPPASPLGLRGWSSDEARPPSRSARPLRGSEREKAARIVDALPAPESLAGARSSSSSATRAPPTARDAPIEARSRARLPRRPRHGARRAWFVRIAAAYDEASGHDLVWGVVPAATAPPA